MRGFQTSGFSRFLLLASSVATVCMVPLAHAQSPALHHTTPAATPATVPASKVPATHENITVHAPPLPSIVLYPHATPTGQPVRTTGAQGRTSGRQYDWGVFNRGNGEAAGFGPVGQYGVAPWAEDWSRLRDKSKRTDPFDVLKYIALNESGSIWLSFSGETRLRNWFESRPNLGTQKITILAVLVCATSTVQTCTLAHTCGCLASLLMPMQAAGTITAMALPTENA